MEKELSAIIGEKVDWNTSQFLSSLFRDQVVSEAETQYVAYWKDCFHATR
jgi:predicted nucleotidyltransferase